ncbi:MAG: substrate-binding domain-containing protein [Corynebacterium sp.]|uniref:substrate-binding domain-containing protein n=1 Tax=Corynebacterium sp. TaxID=1720 RepID=UPI0026DBB2EE|nr:substrate-binding domain-containing protein [Corynebacterium sp.]MDO4761804.1 substrate-binding domain-containing protein [Corynebacterium sp.]
MKLGAIIGSVALLSACSSTGGAAKTASSAANVASGGVDTPKMVVAMVTHGAPGDTFWDLVRKGAEDAAKKNNMELRYSSDPQAPNQANLVQAAIDAKVDGIAVTLPNADAIGPAAKKAVDAKIPTVALNAGMEEYKNYNISGFFGQEEKVAGTQGGVRLAEDGAKHVLCVIHEQGNSSQESRCAGVAEGLDGKGKVEILYVNGQDLTSVQSTLKAKLAQEKNIDWIMSLQASVAMRAVDAVGEAGAAAKVATFDTNAELVDAIAANKIAWAIDQQPYLQGYMAIDSLWLAKRNGATVGGGRPVYTGPSFVDSSNVELIAEAAKAGLR